MARCGGERKPRDCETEEPGKENTNNKDSGWLVQQSPTFLATGTSFLEDNFSTGGAEGRMVQAVM